MNCPDCGGPMHLFRVVVEHRSILGNRVGQYDVFAPNPEEARHLAEERYGPVLQVEPARRREA